VTRGILALRVIPAYKEMQENKEIQVQAELRVLPVHKVTLARLVILELGFKVIRVHKATREIQVMLVTLEWAYKAIRAQPAPRATLATRVRLAFPEIRA
jgi:hypothetical protein